MSEEKQGSLYLIPSPLNSPEEEADIAAIFPQENIAVITRIDHFIVENEKSARKFIGDVYRFSASQKKVYALDFYLLNTHTLDTEIPELLAPLLAGHDMGIISEAGCPGVADPGAAVVRAAHEKGIRVIPLVGPSAILLAIMASGLSGQSFAFDGYLPKDREGRRKRLQDLEQLSRRTGQTQVFMETPYRNQHLVEDILDILAGETLLCIASDITLPTEQIETMRISQWKGHTPRLDGRPSVFLLSASKVCKNKSTFSCKKK